MDFSPIYKVYARLWLWVGLGLLLGWVSPLTALAQSSESTLIPPLPPLPEKQAAPLHEIPKPITIPAKPPATKPTGFIATPHTLRSQAYFKPASAVVPMAIKSTVVKAAEQPKTHVAVTEESPKIRTPESSETSAPPSTAQSDAIENTPLTETAATPPSDGKSQRLETFYKQRNLAQDKFTSTPYFFKVFAILGLLLGGFYLVMRFIVAKNQYAMPPVLDISTSELEAATENNALFPSSLQSKSPAKSWLNGLFSHTALAKESGPQIRVLSRFRLAPTKEIYVVQIGKRQLVLGSTAQQLTLLTDLSVEPASTPPPAVNDVTESAVYKKYLKPPAEIPTGFTAIPPRGPARNGIQSLPETEEIVLLNDYEDDYEPI